MKVVTWNINGIKARLPYLEQFFKTQQPDVLCLQELKSETEKVPVSFFRERGYEIAIHGQKSWNGVAIASKHPISDVVMGLPNNAHEGHSRAITATIQGVRIVNLYCPQGQSADSEAFAFKKRFYDALIDWVGREFAPSTPLILTGDFNIAPFASDVYDINVFKGVPTHHPEELTRWAKLLQWGLQDVSEGHFEENTYTFWDYRAGAFQRGMGMRIDHFLCTKPLQEKVQSVSVLRDYRKKIEGLTSSDHAPVELTLNI